MFLADRFGLTKPPVVPADKDKAKLAAIYDRVIRMVFSYEFSISISKSKDEDTKWALEPPRELIIGKNLASKEDLTVAAALLQELIAAVKDISGPLEAEYLAMIYRARKISNKEPY
jgi:hypothetical protein